MKLQSAFPYYVYIVTNDNRNLLEAGITGDLGVRLNEYESTYREQYRDRTDGEFCRHLVWYEQYADVHEAIAREEKIRSLSPKKRQDLVYETNPALRFMNDEITRAPQSFLL